MMKSIILTQLGSLAKIALWPSHFILHKPRKININIGKPAFQNTTLMSVFNPDFCRSVVEPYDIIKDIVLKLSPDFCELNHAETGTSFVVHPGFWELSEPRAIFFDGTLEKTNNAKITSIWNPILWVPLKETFEEAYNKFTTSMQ